jgi:gamma-glutamyl-gamma-aminobutyrate hydrolase PuuD
MDEKTRKELAALSSMKLVSRHVALLRGPMTDVVNVGVTFRTDGAGKAHTDHDCEAIRRMNDMKNRHGAPLFPFRIVPVTLPRGASGADTPARAAKWSDLDDIHLLYIPGAPVANDTQEGSSLDPVLHAEERDFNRPELPVRKPKEKDGPFQERMTKYLRLNGEHVSRAGYELRLLGIARNRGIPILAVCAGSWRLLESYGGKVRTLEIEPRNRHKAAKPADTWKIENSIRLVGAKTLIKLMMAKGKQPDRPEIRLTSPEGQETTLVSSTKTVQGVNSTHWAVASTTPRITLTTPQGETSTLVESNLARGSGTPSDLLEISAFDVDTDTVEAFESLYGSPTMGIQWHPEGYLPGMMGETSGTEESRVLSKALFELMGYAAQTAKRRAHLSLALNLEGRAFDLLCECARCMAAKKTAGAGIAYAGAKSVLPVDRWSGRMAAVDEAIDVLGEYLKELDNQRMVAAGNLYRDAQQKLKEYGVII